MHHKPLVGIIFRLDTMEGTDELSTPVSRSCRLAHRDDRPGARSLDLALGTAGCPRGVSRVGHSQSARA
jgi:hypothetical protein